MTWIPVGERLPEDAGDVIVFDAHENCVLVAAYSSYWKLWTTEVGDIADTVFEVTHWQPLPEPPGKEGA